MKCEICGNVIEDKYIWCPVCGTKKPQKEEMQMPKDNQVHNSLLIFIGTILYSCLFYNYACKRISTLPAFIFFMIFNILCCMYYSKKNYNITIKELAKSFGLIVVCSFIIQFICLAIFPFPKGNNAFSGLDSLIIIFAPAGVVSLIPHLVYKILYVLHLNKIYISLSIITFLIFLAIFLYNYTGTKTFTNSLEGNINFDTVKINYDSQNKVPIFTGDGEVIKYYKKYAYYIDNYEFYFVLNPGTYEISIKSYDLYLIENDFCKKNRLNDRQTCGYKVDEIKNDNRLYSYSSHYNQYHPGPNEIKNVKTIQKRTDKVDYTIKRFTLNDTYIFETIWTYLIDGIIIKKIN